MNTAEKIRQKEALVGIIGMGYVGLPLVQAFARAGLPVMGFDIDPDKVEKLNAGQSYIKHVTSETVQELVDVGHFEATCDFDRLSEPDCILICVPTPLDDHHEPNLEYVENTGDAIAERLREGQLIVLESTTYPGTTEEMLQPVLEASGMRAERDFYLAYSPEREDPGNPTHTVTKIPKVVGAVGEQSLEAAAALYGTVAPEVVRVSSARAAEATKLLENIYRAVNIALVNEMKTLLDPMDIDVWEVIDAAASKPFGFNAFYPGPGWGGHCIPIDPFYLSWKAREYGARAHFIERAGEVNTSMTEFVVTKITRALNRHEKPVRGSDILILGVSYKPDVDDIRESPALPLIQKLRDLGGCVSYNDPYIPEFPSLRHYPELNLKSEELTEESLSQADAVVVVTDHSCYDYSWIAENAPLVIDTRNTIPKDSYGDKVVRA